jgi:hypothetical protein
MLHWHCIKSAFLRCCCAEIKKFNSHLVPFVDLLIRAGPYCKGITSHCAPAENLNMAVTQYNSTTTSFQLKQKETVQAPASRDLEADFEVCAVQVGSDAAASRHDQDDSISVRSYVVQPCCSKLTSFNNGPSPDPGWRSRAQVRDLADRIWERVGLLFPC